MPEEFYRVIYLVDGTSKHHLSENSRESLVDIINKLIADNKAKDIQFTSFRSERRTKKMLHVNNL